MRDRDCANCYTDIVVCPYHYNEKRRAEMSGTNGECVFWEIKTSESPRKVELSTKKLVYIAHPYSGNEEANLKNVTAICQGVVSMGLPVIPISPLNHTHPITAHLPADLAWALALEIDERLLSLCDELWVFGSWHTSKGCVREINFARERGIKVRFIGEEGL